MSIYSINEWDPLKKVIVGVPEYAQIPPMDKSLRVVNYADRQHVNNVKSGPYPKQVIDESNEDLDIFVNFLKGESVEVRRPNRVHTNYYNYCPRDSVFVYKNTALATPMSLRAREQEFLNIVEHLGNDFTIAENYQKDDMYNESCIGNPEQLALTEIAPKFDAANVIRANDHLLYLVSNSGNRKGAEYLQDFVGTDVKVHTLEKVYSYMHIDSTVAFLREGLLLANPSRIKHKDMLPAPFNKWDIIWAPEPVDIGHYPGLCNSSIWTWNVNLFSINPNLVVLEKHQEPTRKALEAHGIECAMLPIRHARTLGGCFHCCTLDLVREVG
jgi:N-dimethylarginine dimethylaminohydrolase